MREQGIGVEETNRENFSKWVEGWLNVSPEKVAERDQEIAALNEGKQWLEPGLLRDLGIPEEQVGERRLVSLQELYDALGNDEAKIKKYAEQRFDYDNLNYRLAYTLQNAGEFEEKNKALRLYTNEEIERARGNYLMYWLPLIQARGKAVERLANPFPRAVQAVLR